MKRRIFSRERNLLSLPIRLYYSGFRFISWSFERLVLLWIRCGIFGWHPSSVCIGQYLGQFVSWPWRTSWTKNGLENISSQSRIRLPRTRSTINYTSGLNSMSSRRSQVIFLSSTYSSSDGGSFLLDMISSSSSNSAQNVGLIIASTSWGGTFSHFRRSKLEKG